MSNQNNPYPQVSNQPLINNQNHPQVGNAYYPPQNNNAGYVPPPNYPPGITNSNSGPNYPPPPVYNGYGQNPNLVLANQVFGNQGYIPNNQGFIPNNQGYLPGPARLICPICRQ